ncbi:hypothetical protein DH2020_023688 [Rehmannia glutinosa]|uniref:J domain-containing protein n=1 Tax=Rehmannia glutinosa TaxID=99300 RepID=A0ABR0WB33_REHGL
MGGEPITPKLFRTSDVLSITGLIKAIMSGCHILLNLSLCDCTRVSYKVLQVSRAPCVGRESTPPDKIKEAHRRVMVANHPDAGDSHYLASKINEAKDVLLGKTKSSDSAF